MTTAIKSTYPASEADVFMRAEGVQQGLTIEAVASIVASWFSGASLGKQHPWSFLTTRLCGGHHV